MARKNDQGIRAVKKGAGILTFIILIFWGSQCFNAALAAGSASVDISVRPNPLSVEIVSLRTTYKYRAKITAAITNRGDTPVRDVNVNLELSDNLNVQRAPVKTKIIKPGSTRYATWLITAGKPGDYVIKVIATGTLDGYDQLISAEATTIFSFVRLSIGNIISNLNLIDYGLSRQISQWRHSFRI